MCLRLATVAALSCVGIAAAASAAVAADPPGANGTVKLDGIPFDDDVNNEPHLTCDFHVKFFNFDEGERANIVFQVWKPSGPFTEVLRLDNQLISDDPANGGASGDDDAVFEFSASDLGLPSNAFFEHPKQGYHVKLTVERLGNPAWTEKHKVFWLKACTPSGSPSTTTPDGPTDGAPGGGGDGGAGDDGHLPITGPAAGGLALLGAGLIAGGTALMILRRRRDVTFIS